jgi:hypothetical protein
VRDGARDALVGYLYQLVGVAGLQARALNFREMNDELNCELINWIRRGPLLHEIFGHDAAVRLDGKGAVAIQFKYAWSAGSELIQPSDFHEILNAFDRSRREFLTSDPITGYVLITNRTLHEDVQTLYEGREAASAPKGLLPHGNSKLAQHLDEIYQGRENASPHWHAILRGLIICQNIPLSQWTSALRSYAGSHGLDEREFSSALDRLIGNLLQATLRGPVGVSPEWLNEQMVGVPDARPLCLTGGDSAREVAARGVEQFIRGVAGVGPGALVRRRYLQQLNAEISQRALVFLTGGGGCGKSVLAAQYLLEQSSRALVFARAARELADRWLGRALRACRSPGHPDDLVCYADPDALSRIRHANPGAPPPVLIVDVDGLDEWNLHDRHALDRLIEVVRGQGPERPAPACLILTARAGSSDPERSRRVLIRDWLSCEATGQLAGEVGFVFVDDFDLQELSEAAERMLVDDRLRHRIRLALSLQRGARQETATLDENVLAGEVDAHVSGELLASLRHPTLWGAFVLLPAEHQERVLDGSPAGLGTLSWRFLERFCLKVRDRMGPHPVGLDRLDQSLRQVGGHFPDSPAVGGLNEHWLSPLAGILDAFVARHLYDEAISYGLIREDEPGRWRWRHGFIGDCLRRDGGGR